MKFMRLFLVMLLGIFINTAAHATNVALTDGRVGKASSYDVELVSQNGTTWTYNVSKVKGYDLSHWVLGLTCSSSQVASSNPSHDGVQIDPSVENIDGTEFYGIKWNSSGGTFSFTLDQAYAVTNLDVMVKAANAYGIGRNAVEGPDCNSPVSNDTSDDSSDSSSNDSASDDSSDSNSNDSANDDSSDSSSNDSASDDSSDSSSNDSASDDSSETTSNTNSCEAVAGDSETLAAGGGSNQFTVEFLGKNGNEWSYKLSQTGRDLSHWSLGIENCEGHIISQSPSSGFETGSGGASDKLLKNTGVDWMVKWDTDGGVGSTGRVFTLTLDDDYAAANIGVLVKTGGNPQTAVGTITAPNCAAPVSCNSNEPSDSNSDDTSNETDSSNAPSDDNNSNDTSSDSSNDDANDDNAIENTEPEWADGFSGEYIAWGKMGNGSGTSYFGETLYPNDSICTLAQEGILEKAWYEPQWVKARGRIVLFKKEDNQWVQGGQLKMKLSLGWYIVHPKNSRNLTNEPIICPTEMPDGAASPVECAGGPEDKYKLGHYLTSGQVLTSDENGVVEFETYGWWTGVSEGYRDALNLVTADGSPDWAGRTAYVVENHYGGTLRGDSDELLANLDFSEQARGIGRDVSWNASWGQAGCPLPEQDVGESDDSTDDSNTDDSSDNNTDDSNSADDSDQSENDVANSNGGNIDCPAGSEMLAKFEWNGSRYTLEGSNEGGIILRGTTIDDIANAEGGQWTSAVPMAYLVLKGATDNYTYDLQGATAGSFSKNVLEGNGHGGSPDISNMKFCGDPTAPKDFDNLSIEDVEVLSSVRVWDLKNAKLICENQACDAGLLQNFSAYGKVIASESEADLLLEWEVSNTQGLPLRYEYIYLDIGQ